MKKKLVVLFISFCICISSISSQIIDAKENLFVRKHSHNDYSRNNAFYNAHDNGFQSIEADIILDNHQLYVAHSTKEIVKDRTLENLYLKPIEKIINQNNGMFYAKDSFQLMIDIKTEAVSTLQELIQLLSHHQNIIKCKNLKIVISGNRPSIHTYHQYPAYIFFDGNIEEEYSQEILNRIAMISGNFERFSKWNGVGTMSLTDKKMVEAKIKQVHNLNKPVRFWNAPDQPNAWKMFIELGVNFINTDKVEALNNYLKNYEFTKLQLHDSTNVLMPYNRIIKSAGKVVYYGDSSLENHALDVANLSSKNHEVVIEDRYGIAIANTQTAKIIDRFGYLHHQEFKNIINTYSGVKTFVYQQKKLILWSAAQRNGSEAYLIYAEWDGKIKNVNKITFQNEKPASNAIPNDICIAIEQNIPYIYLVLNGNNELLKIRWTDKKVIWKCRTGVAPYGIAKAQKKLYVTNWAGYTVTDTTKDYAGVPWGKAYTSTETGATTTGSVTVIDENGNAVNEINVGLHPTAIISSKNEQYIYVCNSSSDYISVIDTKNNKVVEKIYTGIFNKKFYKEGSSPNALTLDPANEKLYVSNGLDNAIAVIQIRNKKVNELENYKSSVLGFIPSEAYPGGLTIQNNKIVVANIESTGANIINKRKKARSIHEQLASVSIIPIPTTQKLRSFSLLAYEQNLIKRMETTELPKRSNVSPKPMPERIGEPSVFKHVVYIIKENKTYDQVFGDMKKGRGDSTLCVFGRNITPNMHAIADKYGWMDNYYASGKSSAEGHQWTDAGIVSDYVEKNVRAWLRSYPHRQEDALVYNKTGFIWNHAANYGKTVRIYGEACKTIYDEQLKWKDFYNFYINKKTPNWYNTTTIKPIKKWISPTFPDCDNMVFNDQLRADVFIKEWEEFEQKNTLPQLMILSLPNDHTAGTSPGWPTPNAMVADNDLAVGRIIEKITTSRFWDSTVVFITQDDSQSGWDHISAYRTIGLVLSPYSNKQVVTTHYNQTSMLRSIEQILGIPPMHIIDATAEPMFDCFTTTKNIESYKHLPSNVQLDEMNKPLTALKGIEKKYALESLEELFNEVDGGKDDGMNRIIWHYAKGNKPYPFIKK